jgi:hypothetical protein
MLVDSQNLQAVLDLYMQGQMVRAYETATAIAPVKEWRGAAARVMAGRLAMNLGAPNLGQVLHVLAYRESPDDPQAAYYYALALSARRGPLPAWDFLKAWATLHETSDDIRPDWLSLHASILGSLRDCEKARGFVSSGRI